MEAQNPSAQKYRSAYNEDLAQAVITIRGIHTFRLRLRHRWPESSPSSPGGTRHRPFGLFLCVLVQCFLALFAAYIAYRLIYGDRPGFDTKVGRRPGVYSAFGA